MSRYEPSRGGDDPPPRKLLAVPEDVADRARRPWMTRLFGHLAVGHDIARPESAQDGEHVRLERHRG
jgi:hypothetical protein